MPPLLWYQKPLHAFPGLVVLGGLRGIGVSLRPVDRAGRGDLGAAVLALLDALDDGRPAEDGDRTSATLACHAAVRAGMTLSLEEQRTLLRQLEVAQQPRTCPHGRPTMVHVSVADLARGFGRR